MILVIPVSEITKDSPWYKGETSVQPPSQKDLIYECYDRLYEVAKMVRDKCREQPDRYSVSELDEAKKAIDELPEDAHNRTKNAAKKRLDTAVAALKELEG